MRFTDRLNLKLPEPEDSYNIQDFTDNFDEISKSFAGIPKITNYLTLEEYINSGTAGDLKRGDVVAINSIFYILVGSDPLNADDYMVYGAEALVVMREYVPISERIKGSMYLQLGKTRRLIVRVFKKFFGKTKNLLPYPYEENTKTTNGITFTVNDGSINVNGTATANTFFNLADYSNGKFLLKNGTYTLSINSTNVPIWVRSATNSGIANTKGSVNFTIEKEESIGVFLRIPSGTKVENETVYPMIRKAEITDDTWEPYKKVDADASTLLFQKTNIKTANIENENKYKFTCKNLSILEDGDASERLDGKIYFVTN